MIRFPNRFHASETPGAGQIEPYYQSERQQPSRHHARQVVGAKSQTFTFDGLEQAWPLENRSAKP